MARNGGAMNDDLTQALDRIAHDRQQLLSLITPLDRDRMAAERRGGWAVWRVLHHVIEAEMMYGKLLAHQCGKPAPKLDVREPLDGAGAARQLDATRAAVVDTIDSIDDDTLYRLVRIGHEEYSPLSVLENIALHDREHYGQLIEILGGHAPGRAVAGERSTWLVQIRPATLADLPRLTEIYNYYVEHTPITFDIDPFTVEERRAWFDRYAATGRHRLLVAEIDATIAGYASTSPFHARKAYETTVEMTVLCALEFVGRGIGGALYERLFEEIAREDIHAAVAAITMPNDASAALHEAFGFKRTALLEEVGRKFDRYWDVLWMSRTF